RFNADGTPDVGFGSGGAVKIDFGADDLVSGLALQPDGNIVFTTFSLVYDNAGKTVGVTGELVRYTANGVPDTTLNTADSSERFSFDPATPVGGLLALPDGTLAVGTTDGI